MTIWAIVKFQFEGWHRWKDAPENQTYNIDFLRNLHRHMFHVEVWIEQKHNERDIEYLTFKDWLTNPVQDIVYTSIQDRFGITEEDSCETMAEKIRKFIVESYPDRKVKVFVFEDNENGACVE